MPWEVSEMITEGLFKRSHEGRRINYTTPSK